MVFSLMAWYLPIECNRTADNSSAISGAMQTFDCSNGEKVAPDLVVTKLSLEMDSRTGLYQECNLCDNGQDPMSKLMADMMAKANATVPTIRTCAMEPIPEYICGCAGMPLNSTVCDGTVVGKVAVAQQYQGMRPSSSEAPETDWWGFNLAQKLNGTWYSTPDEAQCPATEGSATGPCSWRATPIKRVSKRCHAASMANSILADSGVLASWQPLPPTSSPAQICFNSCPVPADTPPLHAGVNTAAHVWPRLLPDAPLPTDPCWLRCFFQLVLGPHGGDSPVSASDGVPNQVLAQAWDKAFQTDEEALFGCPALSESSSTTDDTHREVSHFLSASHFAAIAAIALGLLGVAKLVRSKIGGKREKVDRDGKGMDSLLEQDFLAASD